ncbi:hypothetical protein SUDANB25_05585 [Streptomyces sp. SudanB25_2051]
MRAAAARTAGAGRAVGGRRATGPGPYGLARGPGRAPAGRSPPPPARAVTPRHWERAAAGRVPGRGRTDRRPPAMGPREQLPTGTRRARRGSGRPPFRQGGERERSTRSHTSNAMTAGVPRRRQTGATPLGRDVRHLPQQVPAAEQVLTLLQRAVPLGAVSHPVTAAIARTHEAGVTDVGLVAAARAYGRRRPATLPEHLLAVSTDPADGLVSTLIFPAAGRPPKAQRLVAKAVLRGDRRHARVVGASGTPPWTAGHEGPSRRGKSNDMSAGRTPAAATALRCPSQCG